MTYVRGRHHKQTAVILLGLALISFSLWGCSVAPASPPTATATVAALISAATAPPTSTSTPTFTAMPTRTPAPRVAMVNGEPTATWTPVPGNPVWSFWKHENVEFQLPVAWRKVEGGLVGEVVYEGPGGDDRPYLSLSLRKAAEGSDAAHLAQDRLAALKPTLNDFALVKSETAPLSALPAQRLVFRYQASGAANEEGRTMQRVAWYAVRSGIGYGLECSVDSRRFGTWERTFENIAARVQIVP
jgi:hypothetical protein